MKNLFKAIALVAIFAAATTSANAQLYLSGNVSMSHTSGKNEIENPATKEITTTDEDPTNGFSLGAEIGYYFNDNMAFGADVTFSHSKSKDANDNKIWTANNSFNINPYFRYDFVSTEKISFGAKAEALIGFGKNKNNEHDLYKTSQLGVAIIPVLNYKFTPNWSAGVQFGALSYIHHVSKNAANEKNKSIDNIWNCNLTLSSLTFSVVYTF